LKPFNNNTNPKNRIFTGCFLSKNRAGLKSTTAGFTLIEMMIVIAIIAILSAFAFPSLSTLIPRYRTKAVARQLRGYLQKAKLEAIKQNTDCLTVFTPYSGADDGSCVGCISSDNDCADIDDEIIFRLNFNNHNSVRLKSTTFSGGIFFFNSRGRPKALPGSAVIQNKSENSHSFTIKVASSGRIRIE
jgi:prepilin-type N-terminal cleavage/methylation domain-containing protein